MNTELHKRLEEAADRHCKCDTCILEHKAAGGCLKKVCSIHNAYLEGAEHGYKEAIAQAKKWLEKKTRFAKAQYCNCEDNEDDYYNGKADGLEAALVDFERDMNKLWEEKE